MSRLYPYPYFLTPQHERADKRHEEKMGEYVKKGNVKEFEKEITRWEKAEQKANQRAWKKYDRETRHDW